MEPLPPPPQQPQPQYQPPKKGMGCCAIGCITLAVIFFLGLVALIFGSWYAVHRSIGMFTSDAPMEVSIPTPSDELFLPANDKLNQMRAALQTRQASTFTFTADELNALIARHPDFAPRRGTVRVAIANSVATVEMSVPLDSTNLPGVKHRWFNGQANFGFIYADEGFRFDLNWIEANGHHISDKVLSYARDGFNRGFTRGFDESVKKEGTSDYWRNVKTMTLDEDKLVIITRGE